MRLTPDTNVLVRVAVEDDPEQARLARETLSSAELIAVTLPALCEFVWVLSRGYRKSAVEVAAAIRKLIGGSTVHVAWPAVEAGLAILEKGGDFADGVIAFEGRRLGGVVFASFDRNAARLVLRAGGEALLLS